MCVWHTRSLVILDLIEFPCALAKGVIVDAPNDDVLACHQFIKLIIFDWKCSTSEGEITVVVSLNYCNIRSVYVCTICAYVKATFKQYNKRRLARNHAM
jgi:hypothetical protein